MDCSKPLRELHLKFSGFSVLLTSNLCVISSDHTDGKPTVSIIFELLCIGAQDLWKNPNEIQGSPFPPLIPAALFASASNLFALRNCHSWIKTGRSKPKDTKPRPQRMISLPYFRGGEVIA